MKKLGIMILALLFAGTGMVNAQQQQQRKMQMRTYFQQTVLPFIEQQQAKLEKSLSSTEKVSLENIRKEMTDFRKQGAQIRKSMQGNFNQQVRDSRKVQFNAIIAKARKLADAHPKEAEAYKKAIESEMPKWEQHRQAMTQGKMNGREQGHGMMSKKRQPRMQKLSDPALGLLMNGHQMNAMMMHHPRGMKGNRQMGNMNRRHKAMMKTMQNPEIRAKVKAYAEKNIFPVISKERAAFDKVLSNKEKKVIAKARLQMQAQKTKMTQMHEKVKMGKMNMSDSSRLAMRQQMDKNRVALRQIVLHHYGELQKQMAPLKEKMPQWRAGIHNIIMPNQTPQQMKSKRMSPMAAKANMKDRKEIMFLLFDPQHPDNNLFMPPMKRNKRK